LEVPSAEPFLAVPHHRQPSANSCFPTSLRMVFAYCWECDIPLDDICFACGTTEGGTHILGSISGTLKLMKYYGIDATVPPELWLQALVAPPLQQYIQNVADANSVNLLNSVLGSAILIADAADALLRLTSTLHAGHPAITFLKIDSVTRHAVVVTGISETHVVVKDPAFRVEEQPVYILLSEFLQQWSSSFYYTIVVHKAVR
jgi:hypothetical protein